MIKENVLKDERLINLLKSRGISSKEEIKAFVNPTLRQLYNPFWLNGITEAVQIIKEGIKQEKRFAIVGDYDCDGIMASTILYQYFIRNYANVKVFIPNRFDDGYGLNNSLSQEIIDSWNPDILITVDLGISCVKEVEFLKKNGVEVIVTDHHEPQEVLPDCVIIDPKIKQSYPCSFLCGTGVAFKLVSALAGNDFANDYLDIVSIATIGDIVPLLSENRAIASVGLERLNKRRFSLPSIKYLFDELKLNHITSQDVYLKIVPKINSSGRMDNGQKVFEFINSTNKAEMRELFNVIMVDNIDRLEKIEQAMKEVNVILSNWESVNKPLICVKGDFHQGILGIIASRIVADFNRPALVFAPTKEGTIKASGRSVGNIDLHALISENSEYCLHFGGHKMAVGLEIKSEDYANFVSALEKSINNQVNDSMFIQKDNADIYLTSEDISSKFLDQLNLLAPFGCENPKPNFAIRVSGPIAFLNLGKQKTPHIKLNIDGNSNIIYFRGRSRAEQLRSKVNKEIFIDLDYNFFKEQKTPQAIVKSVVTRDLFEPENVEGLSLSLAQMACLAILSDNSKRMQQLQNLSSIDLSGLFGTAIMLSSKGDLKLLDGLDLSNFNIVSTPTLNKQNCVVINGNLDFSRIDFSAFNNLIVLSSVSDMSCFNVKNVYYLNNINFDKIEDVRVKCGLVYSAFAKNLRNLKAENIFDICQNVTKLCPNITQTEALIMIYALCELGLISIKNDGEEVLVSVNFDAAKTNLKDSKILLFFGEVNE